MVSMGLMIEGQDGLTWSRWESLLRAAEELGFSSVFRSDHFTNPQGPNKPALELWASLTYAASHTSSIEFGPLVAPVTFRLPALTANAALAVDALSNGRLILGIGAGWQEREHREYGIPFPPTPVRMQMFEEYVQVVRNLLRADGPTSFGGTHYKIENALLLPRPERPGRPPILIGGNGERRTLPVAARYADEWNAVFAAPERLRSLTERFLGLLDEAGRPRDAVKRSAMVGTLFARDDAALRDKLARSGLTVEEATGRGILAGTPSMWVEQLGKYLECGVQRIMVQWLEQDNLADLEIIARDVMPQLSRAT